MKTSDTTEEDSETPKPVDGGAIKTEFSSDYFYNPNILAVTKSTFKNFGPE